MGKEILKTTIKRQPGYLYYCSTDKLGNLTVCEALMARKGKAKASTKSKTSTKTKKKK